MTPRNLIPIHWLRCAMVGAFVWQASAHAAEPSALVTTQALQLGRLPITLTGFGLVTPESGNQVNVSIQRAGVVERLRVPIGALVRRGQPLMEINVDPAAAAAYAQARNKLVYTESEARRIESLVAQQLATQSQLAAARQALADARESLRVQERLGGGTEKLTVSAPISGLIVALPVAQGDRVPAGANVAQLANTDSLHVALGVEPGDALRIRTGMKVSLVSVFDETHPVEGEVVLVQRAINPQSQLVDAVVRFRPKPEAGMFPGLRVRGEIHLSEAEGWLIPRSAIVTGTTGVSAFQVADAKAKRVAVEVLAARGNQVLVRAPFDARHPLVTVGAYQLTDGMAVRQAKP